jgi:ADP-dependent NAD(P)H-hydrate dehydratase / NAD(P)H-hydrate epimerase
MMTNDYWHKQNANKMLFPDLAWSKPENKRHAGKLLIVGGNLHGFAAPAQAFTEASKAGIGTARVLLPDTIQKLVGGFLPEASFGPSTPSGSFASKSLSEWLENASWADGTLLSGDLGRNSETAIVLESFLAKHTGAVTLTNDAADYITQNSSVVLSRPNTLLVLSFAQLQKLAIHAKFTIAFTFDMDLIRLVEALHMFTTEHSMYIVTKHLDTILVAVNGRVSSTNLPNRLEVWQAETAAHASVWWLQHTAKPFEAITSSLLPLDF